MKTWAPLTRLGICDCLLIAEWNIWAGKQRQIVSSSEYACGLKKKKNQSVLAIIVRRDF